MIDEKEIKNQINSIFKKVSCSDCKSRGYGKHWQWCENMQAQKLKECAAIRKENINYDGYCLFFKKLWWKVSLK